MRKTNPIFAGVAAVALAATMVPAFALAADTKDTNVKYDVTESYTWSVPSTIDFTDAENATVTTSGATGDTQNVAVTTNVIAAGKTLHISLADSNTFKITSEEGAELSYTVSKETTELAKGADVLTVAAGTNADNQALTFTLKKDSVEKAGNYTGTVTFAATVK